jgi:hypothetical protein
MIFAHLFQSASSLPTDASTLESAISALEKDIKALENSSVPWEHSVWVFTLLVAVGVAMELWVIRHEYRDDMEAWALAHFGVLRSPGRPSITKLIVEVGSVLLITIGIIGELGVGIKIASINVALRGKSAELRTNSDRLVALLRVEAQQTQERAAQIEASMMLRRLPKKAGEGLCQVIPKSVIYQVGVISSSQDWESYRYAEDFDAALRSCIEAAKLPLHGTLGNSFWSQNVVFGVWVRFQKHFTLDSPTSNDPILNPRKRRTLAESVRETLEANGVRVEGISDQGVATLEIYVGPRFPPEADAADSNRISRRRQIDNH